MATLAVPHDAVVFVGDGRKALILRNHGDEKFPNLRQVRVLADDNPPTHEQGSDKPGRAFARAGGERRSAVEATDWHDIEERRFARAAAAALQEVIRDSKVKALVIAAPPRTLAVLRQELHADVRKHVIAELDKDLTKEPIHEIERHLVAR